MSKYVVILLISLCLLGVCAGCSSALLGQRGSYLRAYHEGDLIQAEQNLNAIVQKEIPQEHYTKSKEASWLLLDRATTRFAMGKIDEAIQDYANAIEALDYYAQDLPTEKLGQLLLQDETGAYQADDFEQVLARIYFALALLHQGDESNAYALLRQAEEYQQNKREIYTKVPFTKDYSLADNGLSKYLFAVLLEKRGDHSNADILYQQAMQLIPCTHSLNSIPYQKKQATVLVFCHNGNAPYKISTTSPASIASLAALEILLATQRIDPSWSSLVGIPVPALKQWPYSAPFPTHVGIDGVYRHLLPFYDVTQAASTEIKQKIPIIAARGVARILMRRSAIGCLQKQDKALGTLADLTMCVINHQTRADTRSWTTLPALIEMTRFDLDPGLHTLDIQVEEGLHHPRQQQYQLNLQSNDLCIIHVFNIHPGIRRILIPYWAVTSYPDSISGK